MDSVLDIFEWVVRLLKVGGLLLLLVIVWEWIDRHFVSRESEKLESYWKEQKALKAERDALKQQNLMHVRNLNEVERQFAEMRCALNAMKSEQERFATRDEHRKRRLEELKKSIEAAGLQDYADVLLDEARIAMVAEIAEEHGLRPGYGALGYGGADAGGQNGGNEEVRGE